MAAEGAAMVAAEGGEGAAAMPSLSDAVLNMTLSFLDSDSLVSCQSACRLLASAAQSGEFTAAMLLWC